MLIGIAGDWHGNIKWAQRAIPAFKRAGAEEIFHLGDLGLGFGRYSDANAYANSLNYWLDKSELTMNVVLGNHEGYDWIEKQVEDEPELHNDEGIRRRGRLNILPRGYVFERPSAAREDGVLHGLALGGASSIDFRYRKVGFDWWLQENITPAQADRIIERIGKLRRIGIAMDIMLAHDAPFGIAELDALSRAGGWRAEELTYANQSRAQLDRVFREVMPAQFWHGHWHHFINRLVSFDHAEGEGGFQTLVRGTELEWTNRNTWLLDTDTLLIEQVKVWKD
jgi:hypothetical protein